MGVSNLKNAAAHPSFEFAGAAARIRRGGKSVRSGRRSALLSIMTSVYANASRGNRSAEASSRNVERG